MKREMTFAWGRSGLLLAAGVAGFVLLGSGATLQAAPKSKPAEEAKPSAKASSETEEAVKSVDRFRNFIVPQILVQDATVEQAMERFTKAYEDAARRMGDTTAKVPTIDFSAANRTARFNLITPKISSADSVLRLLAAMAGNKTTGEYPNYTLTALDATPRPDSKGSLATVPDLYAWGRGILGIAHLEDQPEALDEIFRGLGIGNDQTKISMTGGTLNYAGLSEADEDKLKVLVNDVVNQSFPVLVQMETRMAVLSGSADKLGIGPVVAPEDYAWTLRKLAKLQGGDLRTFPTTDGRFGEDIIQQNEITRKVSIIEGHDMDESIGSQLCQTICKRVGLGSTAKFCFDANEPGLSIDIQKDIVMPMRGAAVVTEPLKGNRTLVIVLHPVLKDATGRLLPVVP